MTRLRAHYDAKLKAFVPEEPVDLPDGAAFDVTSADEAEPGAALPTLPAPPATAPVTLRGGTGISGRELVSMLERLDAEYGTAFPEPLESTALARKLRESRR